MKKKDHALWGFLKSTKNPIWLTVVLAMVAGTSSVLLSSHLQQSQQIERQRQVVVDEYIVAATNYTHQLFIVVNYMDEYRQAFNNWHDALSSAAAPDTIERLGIIAMQSEDAWIDQDTELGRLNLKFKTAYDQLPSTSKKAGTPVPSEPVPQINIERTNYLALIEKYKTASPEMRAQMSKVEQEAGSQILLINKEIASLYRAEYESLYNALVGILGQQ